LFTTTLGELAVGGVLFVTTVLLTVFVSESADPAIAVSIMTTSNDINILFLTIYRP